MGAFLPIFLQLLANAPTVIGDVEGALAALRQSNPSQADSVIAGIAHLAAGAVSHIASTAAPAS